MPDSYDEVPYPSRPWTRSHPAHVAAIAALAGMELPPVVGWRVLEIGCGDAANLLPLAVEYPEARFIGVDRAPRPLTLGRARAAKLGLGNLELHEADLLDWHVNGAFDYIIAHGVYSWVPPEVRRKILAICEAALAPQGIAFISYNALPGCHFRRFAWDLVRFHARRETDPKLRQARAREVARVILDQPAEEPTAAAVSLEMENVLDREPAVLYHDDLSALNEPLYLLDFAEQASGHGLQYLGDAEPVRDNASGLPFESGDWLEDRQYADFLKRRRFRETLLCRSSVSLDRRITLDHFRDLFAASGLQPGEPQADGQQRFASATSGLTTNHPVAKDLLCRLAALWPASVRISDLPLAGFPPDSIAELLMRLFEGDAIELRTTPPRVAAALSERPAASALARIEIAEGSRVITNQRHRNVDMSDENARRLISLLDGGRDRAALAALMAEPGVAQDKAAALVEAGLKTALRYSLLVA